MAGKHFAVTRRVGGSETGGGYIIDYVEAWDFTIVSGALVFSNRERHTAYNDWIKVEQEN